MRNICHTSLQRTFFYTVIAVLMLALAVCLFMWMLQMEPELLDPARIGGVPEEQPEEQGYSTYLAEGVCSVALCANPLIHGKEVQLYLTNLNSNDVWLRAEIYTVEFVYDASGKLTGAFPDKKLGMSGFIKPGEYVETIVLDKKLKEDKTYVMIKISTYVEDTALSNGFFYVNTTFHG